MSCTAFHSVQAINTPDGVKTVYWRMSESFHTEGRDLLFYVDCSEESLGDWIPLNSEDPVTDGCIYVDTLTHKFNMVSDVWYRVRAVLRDSSGQEPDKVIESIPTQITGALSDRAYSAGRVIMQSFYKTLKKGGGQQGFLLKRKLWGERCPECTDFDVETIINAHCHICYGTGIVGGYHEGIEFWVMPSVVSGRQRQPSPIGITDDYGISAQCAAYPWIDAGDVWIDAKTGERFVIKAVSHVAELERKPLILSLSLVKVSNTDILMDTPVAEESETFENENEVTGVTEPVAEKFPVTDNEVIKSDEASSDRGWRRGLKGDDW